MKRLKPEIVDWLDKNYSELFVILVQQKVTQTQYHKSRLESLKDNFLERFKRPLTIRILELYGK